MIKLDPVPTSLRYAAGPDTDLESGRRLIVLVPAHANYSAATRRIRELAHVTGMHVQLLALSKDTAEESELRRELITMASLLQDGEMSAEAKVVIGTNWLDVLTASYKAGDAIVCCAEQSIGLLHRPLSQILEANFAATVYILAGLAPQKSRSNRLSQTSAWLGPIVIIIGFGILQAKIVQLPGGWLQNLLLILSILPEFWLIWAWDSRLS